MEVADTKTTIRFATYNVLSTHLASPEHHVKSKAEDLDHETRFQRILDKIEIETENNSIIVLQEVSESWAPRFSVFFNNINYFFFHRGYGGEFTGYMGVAVAVPLAIYRVIDLDSRRISDTVYWPDDKRFIRTERNYSSKTLESMKKAQGRQNTAIWAKIEDKATNKVFCVGTYHMPCMFWDPKIMNIHAALMLAYLQEKSGSLPLLVGGDFNIKPDASTYKMIISGTADTLTRSLLTNKKNLRRISYGEERQKFKISGFYSKKNKNKKTKSNLETHDQTQETGEDTSETVVDSKVVSNSIAIMRSAYKEFQGQEPAFTDLGWSKGKHEAFIGTLDYIFLSQAFAVKEIRKLITVEQATAQGPSLPNAIEPSDHLLLAATVEL